MEMFEVSSNWIIALGKTLIHSLWIGVLFLSLLKTVYLLIPPRFAVHRYRFASSVLFLFTVFMAILFSILYTPARETSVPFSSGLQLINPVFQDFQEEHGWQHWICQITAFTYLAGVVAYLLYTIVLMGSVHSIRISGKPAGAKWKQRFDEFKIRAGIGARTLLLVSERTRTPFLSGIIRPVIIVPAGMLTQLPFSQVESILMHELFHLKRLDQVANFFQRIVEILFFYNPAVRVISRTIRNERENCCDDLVLQECSQPLDYARALYQLAMEQGKFPAMVQAASGNSRGLLKNRIQRILNPATMKSNIYEKLSAFLLLAGGLIILAVISGFSPAFSVTQHKQNPKEIIQPVNPVPEVRPVPEVQPEPSPLPHPVVQPDTLNENAEKVPAEKDIDWDEIKKEIESAKVQAMEEIDWDEIKKEIESAKVQAMEEIDWDQIKEDIEVARIHLDSVLQNLDFDLDMDME